MISRAITLFLLLITSPLWAEGPHVLVTIAPYRPFAERLVGDEGKVTVMVPPGTSAHTFEATPKHILQAAQADIWFTIGEPFEERALPALQRTNNKLTPVDLRKGIALLEDHTCCCCHHHDASADPHFWLSPRRMAIQIETMAEALAIRDPDNKEKYTARAQEMIGELQALDRELETVFSAQKAKPFLVSHPAYGYFADDYALEQLSVEFEGRDPTPKQLETLLQKAREEKIHTVFIQAQYNTKGAERVASALGAKKVTLDPFSEDYFGNLRAIARHIQEQ